MDPIKVGLAVVSLLMGCALMELTLRLIADRRERYADPAKTMDARFQSHLQASPDSELIYVLRPDYSKDAVRYSESHGILRATDVSEAKPSRTFRIAVIGDSIAAGLGNRQLNGDLPFPDKLEQILRNELDPQRLSVEVLNFGTDGYGTMQEARLLETRVRRFSPDLVILEFCYNDVGNSFAPTIWFLDQKPPLSYLFEFVVGQLGLLSRPGPLDPAVAQYVPETGPIVSEPATVNYWRSLYAKDGPGWKRVSAGFQRIAAEAGRLGAPVVVVLFPLLTGDEGDPALLAEMRSAVVEEIGKNHFQLVDLAEQFSRVSIEDIRSKHAWDHFHPSPLGHTIAARLLATFVIEHLGVGRWISECVSLSAVSAVETRPHAQAHTILEETGN